MRERDHPSEDVEKAKSALVRGPSICGAAFYTDSPVAKTARRMSWPAYLESLDADSSPVPLASFAPRFDMYERSVQSPHEDVSFMVNKFRELRGREALSLREDFCGTALVCAVFVSQGDPRRTAIGVDLCQDELDFAETVTMSKIRPDQANRVTFVKDDVLVEN